MNTRRKPDATDLKVMHLLQQDGRTPNTEIAQVLGLSEANVRRRIKYMVENGLIRTSALVDHRQLGYTVEVLIAIETGPGMAKQVASVIAAMPEVRYVGLVVGEYDITVVAAFKSNQELSNFLTDKIGSLQNIRRTNTVMVLDVVKYIQDWLPT